MGVAACCRRSKIYRILSCLESQEVRLSLTDWDLICVTLKEQRHSLTTLLMLPWHEDIHWFNWSSCGSELAQEHPPHYWVNKDMIKEMKDELEVIVVMVMKKIIKDHGGWKWRTEEVTIVKDVKRSDGLWPNVLICKIMMLIKWCGMLLIIIGQNQWSMIMTIFTFLRRLCYQHDHHQ